MNTLSNNLPFLEIKQYERKKRFFSKFMQMLPFGHVCLRFADGAAVVKIKSQKKRNSFEVFEVACNKSVDVN